ncbi:3-hydroxyacyl-CoA dehydrogenase NAD-binding domain-containing protein [Mariprofundus ferrooxydans]|uniref:3-hydroxyacyl-CoA dehydrogenase NAD-binding domain-containing protein n=1 Tax=Mariprofundus ferrooxydans TaxID=314344 RepID=UPI00036F94A7|nr:3-hydroxyacyl-CoA dehydrogenase NAD-binding domain-containing protein [Mariprofundus ferrooxydans]
MQVVTLIRNDEDTRLHFERSDKSVNVLDEKCISQLEAHLDALEAAPPALLVLESGMPGSFIAGADLEMIAGVTEQAAATAMAGRGQALCRRIERLPSLSIAMVHGACMGGGLELALACDYIVAVDDKKTVLGLPEIKIGIHPGFGGCVRLPKRVGWVKAVEMILSGSVLDVNRAYRAGLAALTARPEQCDDAIGYLAKRGKVKSRPFAPWWLRLWPARELFFRQVEKKAMARFKHLDIEAAYPAVPATIALLKAIIGMSDAPALAREAESLGRLAVTPTCKNLIRVFYLGEALKKHAAVKRGRDAVATMQKAAVYGAGVMGGGIAWVASQSMDVDLHEVAAEPLGRGMKGIARLAMRKKGRADSKRLARIRPVLDESGLSDVDVVIEAVLEDIRVKRRLWASLGKHVRKDTLLLSNTSSLSISDMQHRRANAGRIAGLHFFNPAPKMPLVEVVAGEKTTPETVDKVCALAVSWGKYPIIVAESPGFLVNRCLMPYMVAALKLVASGEQIGHVDGALKCFGMPMGALELADRVGLDICMHVGTHLSEALPAAGQRFAMPEWFARMVADGLLGEKTGKGFFIYEEGKQGDLNPDLARYLPLAGLHEHEGDADIGSEKTPMEQAAVVDGCLIPMLVEAVVCLGEQVVDDPVQLDAAFVYGIGFPPFRGGLLRYFAGRDVEVLKQSIAAAGLSVPENMDLLGDFR